MSEIKEKKKFTSVEEIICNGINRDNAIVREWDRIYCNLAQDIFDNGEDYVSRAGEAVGIFAPTFKLDVGKEFPILESKKVFLEILFLNYYGFIRLRAMKFLGYMIEIIIFGMSGKLIVMVIGILLLIKMLMGRLLLVILLNILVKSMRVL